MRCGRCGAGVVNRDVAGLRRRGARNTSHRPIHVGPGSGGDRRKWMASPRDRRARRACAPRALSRGNPALSCIPPTPPPTPTPTPTPPPPTRAQRRRDAKLHLNTRSAPRTVAIHQHHQHQHPHSRPTPATNPRTPAMSTNMDEDIDSKLPQPRHGDTDWLTDANSGPDPPRHRGADCRRQDHQRRYVCIRAAARTAHTDRTACRVQDLEEERPVPLRPDSEVCPAPWGVPAA